MYIPMSSEMIEKLREDDRKESARIVAELAAQKLFRDSQPKIHVSGISGMCPKCGTVCHGDCGND